MVCWSVCRQEAAAQGGGVMSNGHPLSAAQVRIRSSGEIEDDSINTQI